VAQDISNTESVMGGKGLAFVVALWEVFGSGEDNRVGGKNTKSILEKR